jgi:hypothetical protein
MRIFKITINTLQFSLIRHCLCTKTLGMIGKIVDPLYFFQDKTNLILMDLLLYSWVCLTTKRLHLHVQQAETQILRLPVSWT